MHTSTQKTLNFKLILMGIILAFINANIAYSKNNTGVLVSSKNSQIKKIDILELRRAYLRLPIRKESGIANPIINKSNKKVYQGFLKNIMRMTKKTYKKKLIKRIFRQGVEKVNEYRSEKKLAAHLIKNPDDISIMSEETAKKHKDIKIIQKLW